LKTETPPESLEKILVPPNPISPDLYPEKLSKTNDQVFYSCEIIIINNYKINNYNEKGPAAAFVMPTCCKT